jgi:ribosome-associated protein
MNEINVEITTEFIKLDSLLKFSGIAQTGGESKMLISEGNVELNGDCCMNRGKKIRPGDTVLFNDLKINVIKKT